MDDYEYFEDVRVPCEKCGKNDRAYLWFNKNEKTYFTSCDNCGVNEKSDSTEIIENKKQVFCCEGFKEFTNQELYIDKNPRVFELRRRLFYYLENSSNPTVEQIKYCPFCGVKFVGVGVVD
ncbi:MAG TPA: hypothetical protein VFG45_02775 [Candidatus Nitrosocosmicus sp.]|nr:hypothetical protein [Candidatus Nitrosocosmicus sp.]